MKKVISILLSILLIFTHSAVAFAAVPGENGVLKFDENGEFKIFNICDIQDDYPIHETTVAFIKDMIKTHQPDLVVLGGDNSTASKETKADAIKELCEIFVDTQTYFTFVFGNHDDEQGVSREELFNMYKLYGGKYCLAYDAVPSLTGVGTHNLTVKSSDGKKIAYNLYMFDSNSYSYDDEGNRLGYDCVHADQVEWYKNTSATVKAANGGETVKAMAFQHIIVQEINEVMFYEFPFALGEATRNYEGKSYTYLPFVYNIKEGYLLEAPCPGYYNYGQFDAFVETGDVVATFSGHDHLNSFIVEVDGVDIVNTPGCTFGSYGDPATRGIRMITINEADTSVYETEILTISEYVLGDGEYLTEFGDYTKADAVLGLFEMDFFNLYFQLTDLIYLLTGVKL
ncbi:MAG: metallophosphoesterase [Clostridia bacterium]|nr:metallophosphoesterase [Clostridia bacterium]